VRVVADSHAIYWYVVSPGRLSKRALNVLTEAEAIDSIAVSAVTMPDLWMAATRKRATGRSRAAATSSSAPPCSTPSTALALELPLVSRDGRITEANLVDVLW
jgi:hypothetical protein